MKITEQQRNHIIQQIVEGMNNGNFENRIYFEADSLTILYSSDDEAYFVLKPDGTWTYEKPNNLESAINELSDEALLEYLENEENVETQEELDEYFEDLEIV
jgi:hypothetical protein